MSDSSVSLSSERFATSFPFGLVLDRDLRIVQVGEVLRRRKAVEVGEQADATFKVLRPRGAQSLAEIDPAPSVAVVLRHRATSLELKGSLVPLEEPGHLAFFGSPVLHSVSEVAAQKLTLGDFPPSDATPDLLLAMQASMTALKDARELGKELSAALNDAHAAVRAKERFLAVMSHEIRTPLNGFGAMIDLLRTTELTDEQQEQIVTMDSCGQALLALVNDILDLSKMEASGAELKLSPMSLPETVHRVANQFRAKAFAKGLRFDVDCGDAFEAPRSGDERRIGQVIANLLGNAVKFTAEGGIRLSLEPLGEDGARISISDTGIGIAEAAQPSLFDPFTQADDSVTREFGGTGLGLAISGELARAMGGSLELVSSGPEGSTFAFSFEMKPVEGGALPAPVEEAPSIPAADPGRFQGSRILIVEDNQINQVIARRLVEKLGAEAKVVADGQAAVEAVARSSYDLVLMDLMMPIMAGTEATRRIRQLDVAWRDLPIVAFTAGAFEHDRADAIDSGMNGFLEKPVRLPLLQEVMLKHLAPPS